MMTLKNDPYIQELSARCYNDTSLFCRTFFPEEFYTTFSILHEQLFNLIDSGARKIAIAAPRGLGKTTIARSVAAKGILYRDVHFIPYVSCSATVAEMQTENLKNSLLVNPVIKGLWGDIRVSEVEDADESFSKKSWSAFGNTLILPRGAGQQIRGLNWRGHRPQLIIVDDLEDSEEVLNEDNRKKLRDWFFSDLMKSVNQYLKDYRIIYIDTVKHEDSLLTLLLNSSDWDSITLSICDENYRSLVPEYMTDAEILAEVESHREKGMLDLFYREFMNIPISTEDAVFKQAYFKYYDEAEEKLDAKKKLENVIIVDPAKTVKLHSAESAVIGIGIDRSSGRFYVRDLIARRMHPDELYDEALNMVLRLKAKVLAVEVTSLHEFITMPIKNEISKRNMNVEFIELNARGKKEDRIAALAPFYRKGCIFHNKAISGPLEAQLLSFPRCRRFDAIDAEAYVIELLEKAERYFYDEEAEEPIDDDGFPDDLEPAFENWRLI